MFSHTTRSRSFGTSATSAQRAGGGERRKMGRLADVDGMTWRGIASCCAPAAAARAAAASLACRTVGKLLRPVTSDQEAEDKGTNSILYPDELFRYLGTIFSISNFGRSVLVCIDADFCDQICVGMKNPSALKIERKKGTMTRKENMEEYALESP